jgi:hypothetical protein
MFSLTAGKKVTTPGKVFVPQKPVPKPKQVASLTGDNTKVNSQVNSSVPSDTSSAPQEKVSSKDSKDSPVVVNQPQSASAPTTASSTNVLPPSASSSSSNVNNVKGNERSSVPTFAPKGSKAVSFAPLERHKNATVDLSSSSAAVNVVKASASEKASPAVVPNTSAVAAKSVNKSTKTLSQEQDDEEEDHDMILEATFGGLFSSSKRGEAHRQENSLQAKMPKKRKITTNEGESVSASQAAAQTEEDEEGGLAASKAKRNRMKKSNSEAPPASSSSSSNSSSSGANNSSFLSNSNPLINNVAHMRHSLSTGNAVIIQPTATSSSSSSSSQPRVSSSSSATAASSSSSSSKKKKSKSTQSYSIFPASFGTPPSFTRIRAYVKLTGEGAEGLVFRSVDNIPVLSEIDPTYNNSYNLAVNDVVVSVNNLDARYTSFENVMQALTRKADDSRGGIGTSSLHLMNGNSNNISEGTGIIQKNAVVNSMACIVFARPVGVTPKPAAIYVSATM